jgi:hypothetical protein
LIRNADQGIQGVSTRKVDDLVQALGLTGISKSQVSALCQEIDTRVLSFLERPLDGDWPYLWLDATYIKVRQQGRIVSIAAIIATPSRNLAIRTAAAILSGCGIVVSRLIAGPSRDPA